jgi:uncharacterized protein YbjQ (UPF0145 family)
VPSGESTKDAAEAFEQMLDHAELLGANALTGIRYDATEIMSGVSEILIYGTAVKAERVSAI